MKRALALVLLLFCVAGYAQSPAPSVETLKAQIKTFKNQKRYGVRYDKFTDVTTVWFRFDLNEGGRRLGAILKFTGGGDATRYVVYEDRGSDWQHLEHRRLYALIDGERVDLGLGERDSKVSGAGYYRGNVSVWESLTFPINADGFDQLAKGQSVELKIGRREIKLKDEHRQAFRDLLSLMNP
jgi:hypothetical protein